MQPDYNCDGILSSTSYYNNTFIRTNADVKRKIHNIVGPSVQGAFFRGDYVLDSTVTVTVPL